MFSSAGIWLSLKGLDYIHLVEICLSAHNYCRHRRKYMFRISPVFPSFCVSWLDSDVGNCSSFAHLTLSYLNTYVVYQLFTLRTSSEMWTSPVDYVSHPLAVEGRNMKWHVPSVSVWSFRNINMSLHFLAHSSKTSCMSAITQEHVNCNLRERLPQMSWQEQTHPICLYTWLKLSWVSESRLAHYKHCIYNRLFQRKRAAY